MDTNEASIASQINKKYGSPSPSKKITLSSSSSSSSPSTKIGIQGKNLQSPLKGHHLLKPTKTIQKKISPTATIRASATFPTSMGQVLQPTKKMRVPLLQEPRLPSSLKASSHFLTRSLTTDPPTVLPRATNTEPSNSSSPATKVFTKPAIQGTGPQVTRQPSLNSGPSPTTSPNAGPKPTASQKNSIFSSSISYHIRKPFESSSSTVSMQATQGSVPPVPPQVSANPRLPSTISSTATAMNLATTQKKSMFPTSSSSPVFPPTSMATSGACASITARHHLPSSMAAPGAKAAAKHRFPPVNPNLIPAFMRNEVPHSWHARPTMAAAPKAAEPKYRVKQPSPMQLVQAAKLGSTSSSSTMKTYSAQQGPQGAHRQLVSQRTSASSSAARTYISAPSQRPQGKGNQLTTRTPLPPASNRRYILRIPQLQPPRWPKNEVSVFDSDGYRAYLRSHLRSPSDAQPRGMPHFSCIELYEKLRKVQKNIEKHPLRRKGRPRKGEGLPDIPAVEPLVPRNPPTKTRHNGQIMTLEKGLTHERQAKKTLVKKTPEELAAELQKKEEERILKLEARKQEKMEANENQENEAPKKLRGRPPRSHKARGKKGRDLRIRLAFQVRRMMERGQTVPEELKKVQMELDKLLEEAPGRGIIDEEAEEDEMEEMELEDVEHVKRMRESSSSPPSSASTWPQEPFIIMDDLDWDD